MKCINCNNKSFYECGNIKSIGGYGPDLLPGTGFTIFNHAEFSIKICSKCNFVHWFINNSDMLLIEKSKKFTFKEYNEE